MQSTLAPHIFFALRPLSLVSSPPPGSTCTALALSCGMFTHVWLETFVCYNSTSFHHRMPPSCRWLRPSCFLFLGRISRSAHILFRHELFCSWSFGVGRKDGQPAGMPMQSEPRTYAYSIYADPFHQLFYILLLLHPGLLGLNWVEVSGCRRGRSTVRRWNILRRPWTVGSSHSLALAPCLLHASPSSPP